MEKKLVIPLSILKEEYLKNNFNENMFKSDGTINQKYNSFKKTGTIASIFEDHWNHVYLKNKDLIDTFRPNAPSEIIKMIDCYNKNLGCSVFECPECHDLVFIGHTCKSRLCSSCGYKYKMERVENIMQTCYNCNHRQVVFTIPKELRKFFFFPFSDRMDILFQAVRDTIYSLLNESFKWSKKKHKLIRYLNKIKYTPGFFLFLHTFGRDLKWNPHIHCLIAELKLGEDDSVKVWNYFNYNALSNRFQKILLDLLSNELGQDFDTLKSKLYQKYQKGFYVYAEPKKFKSLKEGIEYVTRYCGRLPISENRIINYDGKNVTFSYHDHYDESYHEVTVSAEKFIMMLLRHVIPHQYKIIRYYGFYRKKHQLHVKMIMLIDKTKRTFRRTMLKYRFSILKSFHRDPYYCPHCNTKMEFVFLVT